MKDREKIALVDKLLEAIQENSPGTKPLKCVGTLNRVLGINGHKKAEPGTPVYEKADRYVVYLETLDGKNVVEVLYYKETLAPVINMNEAVKQI